MAERARRSELHQRVQRGKLPARIRAEQQLRGRLRSGQTLLSHLRLLREDVQSVPRFLLRDSERYRRPVPPVRIAGRDPPTWRRLPTRRRNYRT